MQLVLEQIQNYFVRKKRPETGRKIGLISMMFGCRHQDMGRPFTIHKSSYRSCVRCGARRSFNTKTMETYGRFYFPAQTGRGR